MKKLATIGALVVALVIPASALGKSIPGRPHHARAQAGSVLAGAMRRPLLLYAAQARQPKSFGQGMREAPLCPNSVVIVPGRGYGFCGGIYLFRYGKAGDLTTGPAFWRHLRTDRPDDHP